MKRANPFAQAESKKPKPDPEDTCSETTEDVPSIPASPARQDEVLDHVSREEVSLEEVSLEEVSLEEVSLEDVSPCDPFDSSPDQLMGHDPTILPTMPFLDPGVFHMEDSPALAGPSEFQTALDATSISMQAPDDAQPNPFRLPNNHLLPTLSATPAAISGPPSLLGTVGTADDSHVIGLDTGFPIDFLDPSAACPSLATQGASQFYTVPGAELGCGDHFGQHVLPPGHNVVGSFASPSNMATNGFWNPVMPQPVGAFSHPTFNQHRVDLLPQAATSSNVLTSFNSPPASFPFASFGIPAEVQRPAPADRAPRQPGPLVLPLENPFPTDETTFAPLSTTPKFALAPGSTVLGVIKLTLIEYNPSQQLWQPANNPLTAFDRRISDWRSLAIKKSPDSRMPAFSDRMPGYWNILQHRLKTLTEWEKKMWKFFWENFVPGRSLHLNTNPWIHFAHLLHPASGIRFAIPSLMGIYFGDYLSSKENQESAMQAYRKTTQCLSHLRSNLELEDESSDEIVSLLIVLSLRAAVLTECHRNMGPEPQWLQGFTLAEAFLDRMDCLDDRTWNGGEEPKPLRLSQRLVVGRGIILPQMFMALPTGTDVKPCRFEWLLNGPMNHLYKVHGASGFSPLVLHTISQATSLAAQSQEQGAAFSTHRGVDSLLRELNRMEQWVDDLSYEGTIFLHSSMVDWMQNDRPSGYVSETDWEVAGLMSEAWRLTTILYLKCRTKRLRADDTEIRTILETLAMVIGYLPSDGELFTAQAPIIPAFILGLLGTDEQIAGVRKWLERVVRVPTRSVSFLFTPDLLALDVLTFPSTIPATYQVLLRLWRRLSEIRSISRGFGVVPVDVHNRHAWWEDLVRIVREESRGELCLV